jgi:hypothetical protein
MLLVPRRKEEGMSEYPDQRVAYSEPKRHGALSVLDERLEELGKEFALLEQRLGDVLRSVVEEDQALSVPREVGESPFMDRAYRVLEMRMFLTSLIQRIDL